MHRDNHISGKSSITERLYMDDKQDLFKKKKIYE